jgi:hypothetical protein
LALLGASRTNTKGGTMELQLNAAQATTLALIVEAHKSDDVEQLHIVEQSGGTLSVAVNDSFGGSIATYGVGDRGGAVDDDTKTNLTSRLGRVVPSALTVGAVALKTGSSYAAGWGDTENDPSYVVFAVTGEMADMLRPHLDSLNDLARSISKLKTPA